MHKSQGFGAARRWGPHPERFRHVAGVPASGDLLDGVATSWRRVPGGEPLAVALERALEGFRIDEPSAAVPNLVAAWSAAGTVEDPALRDSIRERLARLALEASGLLLEARSEEAAVAPGQELLVKVHATLRGSVNDVRLLALEKTKKELSLKTHEANVWDISVRAPEDAAVSLLPWLAEPPNAGRYGGPGDPDVPLPPPPVTVSLDIDFAGMPVTVELPVQKVWVDPVAGERRRDLEILPPITVTPDGEAVMLPAGRSGSLRLKVRVRGKGGVVRFDMPEGYRVEPSRIDVERDTELTVTIRGPGGQGRAAMRILAASGDFEGSFAEAAIDHPHLPLRTVILPSRVDLVSLDLEVSDAIIGHVPGPGDQVTSSLRRVGFDVQDIDGAVLAAGDLDRYDAILVGIRAFNTNGTLRKNAHRLTEYAEHGGTVVVQYTTKHRTEPLGVVIGPHELAIGRGRVTDEGAAVELLAPDHPLLCEPHLITADDFEGWVQERGLYFAESWDDAYTPLLAMRDPGEEAERGALLVADVGEGRFVYTGLSLFRQLPAGVPGAYRLLANLLDRRGQVATRGAEDPPPVLGSWKNLYLVVTSVLLLLMVALYLITRHFRS
jgi:hypothetical protein